MFRIMFECLLPVRLRVQPSSAPCGQAEKLHSKNLYIRHEDKAILLLSYDISAFVWYYTIIHPLHINVSVSMSSRLQFEKIRVAFARN